MEKFFLVLAMVAVALLVISLIRMPLPTNSKTMSAIRNIDNEVAERRRVELERDEKVKRTTDMLTATTKIDLTREVYPNFEFTFLNWDEWPEASEGSPGVIYCFSYNYDIEDPKYIWKDGSFYRVNWVPSEKEKKQIAFNDLLKNFRKKSKHLSNWRNARHLRRH